MEVYETKLDKLNSDQKINRGIAVGTCILFICLVAFLAVAGLETYNNLLHKVSELEHSNNVAKEDIKYLHKLLSKEKDFLFELN